MSTLFIGVLVVQVIAALLIIVLVLLQHGKGADMGAAFGSGSAGSVFGSAGSSNFLSKMTAISAVVFFIATLALVYVGNHGASTQNAGVMDQVTKPAIPSTNEIPSNTAVPAAPEDKNSIPK